MLAMRSLTCFVFGKGAFSLQMPVAKNALSLFIQGFLLLLDVRPSSDAAVLYDTMEPGLVCKTACCSIYVSLFYHLLFICCIPMSLYVYSTSSAGDFSSPHPPSPPSSHSPSPAHPASCPPPSSSSYP